MPWHSSGERDEAMASTRRTTRQTKLRPGPATQIDTQIPLRPGLADAVTTPTLDELTDAIDDLFDDLTARGELDLTLAVGPNLGDMEAAQALAAEYARNYALVSGVPQAVPLPDIEGIQARVVDTLRAGIADVLGRDPFISVVDQGTPLALPAPPELTLETLEAAPTPAEFAGMTFLLVVANNTRLTRFGISVGTDGPPRDEDVLAARLLSMGSPEVSVDGTQFGVAFGVAVRPSFILALARTLLTPLSLEGEPCECGPIVLSNPRITMAAGKMTDAVDASIAGAVTATITLVDQVRVLHGARSSSVTGRLISTDVAVHPITARAKKLDAESWRNALLAMVAPPQLGRMAVRGILGRLAERQLPALPSPIAMLGARLPFAPRPMAPSVDSEGNPIPSTQTMVLGGRRLDGTTALKADITDALRVSGLLVLRPRAASVGIRVQVRDRARREFSATASDVEMIDPTFAWTVTGATLLGNLVGPEVRFRAAEGATVLLHVTAAGTDGLVTTDDLTLDVAAFLEELDSVPTT
jgi:hypothetical protein